MNADAPRIRVWVHTCEGGRKRLGPTIESLDASDLRGKYEVLEAPMGRPESADWWCATMLRLAEESDLILRLEDDVIVNEHILHNVLTWPALREGDFGIGILFNWDGLWPIRILSQRPKKSGAMCRLDVDISGAQGQLFKSKHVPSIVGQIPRARRELHPGQLIFDNVVTRATRHAGKFAYCHFPSLVNCHAGSTTAAIGEKHGGHFSNKTYHSTWKRGRDKALKM